MLKAYRGANENVANVVRSSCFRRGGSRFGEVLRIRLMLRFVDCCCYVVYTRIIRACGGIDDVVAIEYSS